MRLLNGTVIWLTLALELSSCASIPPANRPLEVEQAKLAPAPADVMVVRERNFRQRLLQAFSPSPTTPTPLSTSSPVAKP